MKNFSRTLLFGAVLAALPMGGALACTLTAWDGPASPNVPIADDPDSSGTTNAPETAAVQRYYGACAMKPAASGQSYVTDDIGSEEPIYRARFYVLTGTNGAAQPSGDVDIFLARGGNPAGDRFRATYKPGPTPSLAFALDGNPVAQEVTVAANRWYSIEVFYKQNGNSTVHVGGGGIGVFSQVALGVPTGTINSVQMGAINQVANSNSLAFDEFESTRSDTQAIGRTICRGDANNNGAINVGDISAMISEINGNTVPLGQPDCTEDGRMNVGDISCVIPLANTGTCGS